LVYSKPTSTPTFSTNGRTGFAAKTPLRIRVVMDNAPFHKRSEISSASSNAGHILDFLPAYSPDLNPIERKWAHAKSIRKKISCSISKLFNFESFYLA
jgi:transposase